MAHADFVRAWPKPKKQEWVAQVIESNAVVVFSKTY